MLRVLPWALAVAMAAPMGAQIPTSDQDAIKNAQQARAALNAMVQALGGPLWLNIQNVERDGHFAAFFQGNPDFGTTEYFEFHQWPDHDRIEITKHRDDVLFYIGNQGWEVTYRGKKALPKKQVNDFLLRRDHSIETVVKVWMKDPRTILTYEGPHLVERHLGVQVSAISADNQAVTIVMDADTHLPLRSEFQSRNATYHDQDTYAEEYDDYHVVQGFPTAFRITRFKDGQVAQQRYIDRARYNVNLPPDFWSPDAAARKIKR